MPELARGARELAVAAAGCVVVGTLLPWEIGPHGRPGEVGILQPAGVLVLLLTVSALGLLLVRGWDGGTLPTIAAGVLVVGVSWYARGGYGTVATGGGGVWLVVAGLTGAGATFDSDVPRPLAGRAVGGSLGPSTLGRVTIAGCALCAGSLVVAHGFTYGAPLPLALALGAPVATGLFGVWRAWSRPVAAVTGVAALPAVVIFGLSAAGPYPIAGSLALVGTLLVAGAGLLEIGGASVDTTTDAEEPPGANGRGTRG